MKKFIYNIIVFTLPILFMGLSAEYLLRNIPNDYQMKKEFLDKHADCVEVLFLGSSHAFYGINPIYCSAKSFNASYSSQSIDYDYEVLKKYEKRMTNLKCIVIPISYFTLYCRLESALESWMVKNYVIYYGINTSEQWIYHSEVLSSKASVDLKRLFSYYVMGNSCVKCSPLGWGTNYKSTEKQDLYQTGKTAAHRHSGNMGEYYRRNVNVLKAIIAIAKSKGAKVIFYTPPGFKSYTEQLDRFQLEQTISTIKTLDDQYKHVDYYNLLTDSTFVADDFYDADHLNEIGAKKLTKLLDGIITKEIDHVIK